MRPEFVVGQQIGGPIEGPVLAFGTDAEYLMEEMLTVYEIPSTNKVRVGSLGDGGYVIIDGGHYDMFISAGICDDDSFEHEFLAKHPNLPCQTFDGQVDGIPNPHPRVTHHKKNIGELITNPDEEMRDEPAFSQAESTLLHGEMKGYSNIFLKMDIEGSEFQWLASLTEIQLNQIKQMVLEVHWAPWGWYEELDLDMKGPPRSSEMGLHCDKHINILRKLMHTHYLVHMHPNNNCGVHTARKSTGQYFSVPDVFEITCIRKKDCRDVVLNTDPIPSKLDAPNSLERPELGLVGPPYTHELTSNPEEYFNSLYKVSYI